MLGHTSISATPIATSFFNPNVTVNVTGNQLTLAIGSSSALAGAFVTPSGNPLTLGFGSISVTAAANVTPTATPFTLGVGTVTVTAAANDPGIITWQPIDPGASQTWVNIDPY
jgi:hypothetical protein